jgi:hypothetical protein
MIQEDDQSQVVGSERRMVEVNAVLIKPREIVLRQSVCKLIEHQNVGRTKGIESDEKLKNDTD